MNIAENERMKIAIPSGELEKDVINFMGRIGLDLSAAQSRRYLHSG